MRKPLAVLAFAAAAVPLALLAPQASGVTRTAATASPSALCPELTGSFDRIYWGFNEPAGSTYADDSHADPANRLSITDNVDPGNPAYTNLVTFGNGAARAAEHGLLTTPAAVLDPGTHDFFWCFSVATISGGDGFNLMQESTSNGHLDACSGGSPDGQIKFGPNSYVKVQGTLGCAKPSTGIGYKQFDATGYHTFGVVRHGDYVAVYVDHTSRSTVHTVGGIGAVNLSGSADRLSVLGKYIESGNYPTDYTVDMCNCAVSWIEMGVAP
jgi:hypothetical protein